MKCVISSQLILESLTKQEREINILNVNLIWTNYKLISESKFFTSRAMGS